MTEEGRDAESAGADVGRLLDELSSFRTLGLAWPLRDRALVAYVVKLTLEPARMCREDLEPLRAVGFGDAEILDIVHVAGYFAYANRIADALGIELEDYRRA